MSRVFSSAVRALVMACGVAFVANVAVGCSSAPLDATGGEMLFDASPPIAPATGCASGGGATWRDLYRDCFGPGHADCGGTAGCHSVADDTGTSFSGFLCGKSQDDCYRGIVGTTSLVPVGGSMTPETTRLYSTLRKTPPLASPPRAMPDQSGFEFDPAALARISAWIKNGAKND